MLALVAAFLAVFGVPRTPLVAASVGLFVADGPLDLAAEPRPERRVAGHRVDFVARRGLGPTVSDSACSCWERAR